ncbi:uncharacterized protein LOC136000710 isoform X3 [Caloenas nicobarica]|uniref:uncharacterized protein LOC136000710 isoform X3 n=1 Tax=Caloenas nicobarica TaxID=187106 RepID=UPI0032B73932
MAATALCRHPPGALSGQDLGEGVRRMEPGSSRWQPVVQETPGQREQVLRREKEQRAARLLWPRQDARQERAELLAWHQQRLSALEQQHQPERLRELQSSFLRLYQHLAAWTEPGWGLGDLMAHGAPSWPSSPALDPNTHSEEQQNLKTIGEYPGMITNPRCSAAVHMNSHRARDWPLGNLAV